MLSNVLNELGGTGSGGWVCSCIEEGILTGEDGWRPGYKYGTMLLEGGRILTDCMCRRPYMEVYSFERGYVALGL